MKSERRESYRDWCARVDRLLTACAVGQAVMLEGGMKLTVLDAHGRVLNERIETEHRS